MENLSPDHSHLMNLLRTGRCNTTISSKLNGLIPPRTHIADRFIQRVADAIFSLAKAAHAVKLKNIFIGYKPSRDKYVEAISTIAHKNFKLENPAALLDKVLHPGETFAVQVEKAFMLAFRILYRSIDACRAIDRPLSQHPKKDSPAFFNLIW